MPAGGHVDFKCPTRHPPDVFLCVCLFWESHSSILCCGWIRRGYLSRVSHGRIKILGPSVAARFAWSALGPNPSLGRLSGPEPGFPQATP
jgi:hypothetical protein